MSIIDTADKHISDLTKREPWIDSLKGAALLAVVVLHTGGEYLPGLWGDLGGDGARGVQIFFIISAYLTCKSLAKIKLNSSSRKNWLIARFFRIAPVYYLSLLFSLLGRHGGFEGWLGSEKTVSVLNILSHVFFLNGMNPRYINSILGVEWYIADLVLFYFFAVFYYKWINSFEKALVWLVLSTIFSSLLSGAVYLIPLGDDHFIWYAYLGNFCFFAELPVIILGVVLYHLFELLKTYEVKNKKIVSYCLGAFSIYLCFVFATSNGQIKGAGITGISHIDFFGGAIFVLIISQYIMPWKILDNIFLRKLGEHSYGIYLFHPLFVDIYDGIMESCNISLSGVVSWGVRFVIILLVSYLFAVLVEKFVGKPMESLGKSIINRRQLRCGAVS